MTEHLIKVHKFNPTVKVCGILVDTETSFISYSGLNRLVPHEYEGELVKPGQAFVWLGLWQKIEPGDILVVSNNNVVLDVMKEQEFNRVWGHTTQNPSPKKAKSKREFSRNSVVKAGIRR